MDIIEEWGRCIVKLFHWKISKSTLLLGFNIFLVITAAFLLLINIQSRRELEESKRGFYSEWASYLINEDSGWDAIQDILRGDSWNDGIVYKKDLEMNADTRGVFYKGDFRKLPLIEGRYFTEEEVSSGSRKVMLGQRFEEEIYEEEGIRYIDILGERFEVIGIFGSAQPTRMDSMKWIPLEAAAKLAGPEGTYIVDGKSEAQAEYNSGLLEMVMEPDRTTEIKVMNDEGEAVESSFPERNNNVIEKIYLAIVFSFILNMILAGTYWGRHTVQRIQVEKMFGFSGGQVILSVLAEYFKIAFFSLIPAGILISLGVLTRIIASGWIELVATAGIIIFGEFVVVCVGLMRYIWSRKISLKRV